MAATVVDTYGRVGADAHAHPLGIVGVRVTEEQWRCRHQVGRVATDSGAVVTRCVVGVISLRPLDQGQHGPVRTAEFDGQVARRAVVDVQLYGNLAHSVATQ